MVGAIVGWRNGLHGPGVPDDDRTSQVPHIVDVYLENYKKSTNCSGAGMGFSRGGLLGAETSNKCDCVNKLCTK